MIASPVSPNQNAKDREVAKQPLPSIDALRQLIRCDTETGCLFWLPRADNNAWSLRHAGKPALANLGASGYMQGRAMSRMFSAHRVVWAFHFGDWPPHEVDHINGVRVDNRICNLRAATHAENGRNQRQRHDNVSGTTGVDWFPKTRKWRARISTAQKTICLGYFQNISDAIEARKCAERKYCFHPNHGQ